MQTNKMFMECSKLSNSEIDKIRQLQPDGWPDITDAFYFYCNSNFCNPIKIIFEGEIIGIGNSILFDKSAWLAHIIVNPDYRNHGIGFKIVNTLLDDIKSRGIETALLIATQLGEPVYLKANFRKVSDYLYFKRESLPYEKPNTNKILPFKQDFYNDIIRLDTHISGENREKVLRNFLPKAFVHISNCLVDGFYIPDLGEGPIFALTPQAGKGLMRFKYATIDKATIPYENHVAIEFIKEIGFVETNTVGKRMILGTDLDWKPEMIYSRIGGHFG